MLTELSLITQNVHSGAAGDMAGLRAQALGHAARLLHARLTPAERQVSARVLHLAEGLMSAGVHLVDDLDALLTLKRYLPGLLKALSMQHSDVRQVGQPAQFNRHHHASSHAEDFSKCC